MKTILAKLSCVLVVTAIFSQTLKADIYNPAQLPADTKWFCHLDFDAIRNSPTSVYIQGKKEDKRKAWFAKMEEKLAERKAEEEVPSEKTQKLEDFVEKIKMLKGRMDAFKQATGFEPKIDIQSCTIYGDVLKRHEGVMLLKCFMNQDKFTSHAQGLRDYKVEDQDMGIVSFTALADTRKAHTTYSAFHGKQTLVFSRSIEDVKAALNVLNGQAANLASTDSNLKQGFKDGTTFGMRTDVDESLKAKLADSKMAWAKDISGADMWMGEKEGKGFFEFELGMNNAGMLAMVKQMAEGGLAFITQQAKTNDQKKLLAKVTISQNGEKLIIGWEGPSDLILAAKGW